MSPCGFKDGLSVLPVGSRLSLNWDPAGEPAMPGGQAGWKPIFHTFALQKHRAHSKLTSAPSSECFSQWAHGNLPSAPSALTQSGRSRLMCPLCLHLRHRQSPAGECPGKCHRHPGINLHRQRARGVTPGPLLRGKCGGRSRTWSRPAVSSWLPSGFLPADVAEHRGTGKPVGPHHSKP